MTHAKPYKGAEIYSSQAHQFGRMEMRMRMARGGGLLSTFFTYKDGSEIDGSFWEEIDIEVLGKDNAVAWQSNIITGLGTRTTSEQVHTGAVSLADDYHTYALEWTPDMVVWKLDGVVVRQTSGGQVDDLTNPETLRFNIWAADVVSWVGAFDAAVLPQYQYVNWISYHRYEGGQFVHAWTDDFDTFDAARWGRADWTFDENLADFDPNNVVVRDGTLVLALTREGQTGFDGMVPADGGGNTGGTGAGGAGIGGSNAGGAAGSGGSGVGGSELGGSGAGGATGSAGFGVGGSGVGGTELGGSDAGGAVGSGGSDAGSAVASGGNALGGLPSSSGTGAGAIVQGGSAVAVGGAGGNGASNATGGFPPPREPGGAGGQGAHPAVAANDTGCGCRLAPRQAGTRPGLSLLWLGWIGLGWRRRHQPNRGSTVEFQRAGQDAEILSS